MGARNGFVPVCDRVRATGSDRADDFVEAQTRQTLTPSALARLADVDHGQDLVLTVGEERFVQRGSVVAGHRARSQAGRANGKDEVRDLQGSVHVG
jgi:hypothetical protein